MNLQVRRAWFEPIDPADYPGLELPDPRVAQPWWCTVEYGPEDRADNHVGTFDSVMDWAVAEDAQELWVFSATDRTYEQFSRADERRLRSLHGSIA